MMKNKVIEMMAKDWNAYADAFSKKDDCVYVVVDNSNDSVEKFYKTFNGAVKYINKDDAYAYGLSKKGIVIVERKEVLAYIEATETEKKDADADVQTTYNVGDIIEGYLSVGEKNPFYNDRVKLVVKRVVKTMHGYNIEATTMEKRAFEHHVDTFNKHNKLVRSEKKYVRASYTGWLDQIKLNYKIYDSKLNF